MGSPNTRAPIWTRSKVGAVPTLPLSSTVASAPATTGAVTSAFGSRWTVYSTEASEVFSNWSTTWKEPRWPFS